MVLKWTMPMATTVALPKANIGQMFGSLRALAALNILRIVGKNRGKEKNAVNVRR